MLAMILVLQQLRGLWLDEAASYWLSRHDVGWLQLARERWITDVHPPLFSMLSWAARPLLGESIQHLRMINLAGLLFALMVWRRAAESGLDGFFLASFGLAVAASPFFILYAAEFRSYFLQMVLSASLVVLFRMVVEGRGGMGWLSATLLLLTNLHYYGCLSGLILVGVGTLYLRRQGRGREALTLCLSILVSLLPLVMAMLAMISSIEPVKVSYASPVAGVLMVVLVGLSPAMPNIALLYAIGRARKRRDALSDLSILLALACGLTVAAYALLNLFTHNLLPRHMISVIPIAAGLLASLAERELRRDPRLFRLSCYNAVLLSAAAFSYGLTHSRWESNVTLIKAALRQCPASPVYALNGMSLVGAEDPLHRVAGINDVFALTYQLIARRAGWRVVIVPDGQMHRPHRGCPSLLWIEHFYARQRLRDEQLARLAGFTQDLSVARLQSGGGRALLAISQAPPNPPLPSR